MSPNMHWWGDTHRLKPQKQAIRTSGEFIPVRLANKATQLEYICHQNTHRAVRTAPLAEAAPVALGAEIAHPRPAHKKTNPQPKNLSSRESWDF